MEFSIETHITVDVNDMLRVIAYTLYIDDYDYDNDYE